MRSFANWMIVTFMAMFWGFRVFITYMATSGSDFLVKPIDTTVEIVLLFITLACIILVIKRQLFGGILYTVANVGYFGTDAWLAVKPLLTGETMSAGNSLTVLVAVVAVIAFFIALNPKSSIMGLVSDAWAGFGSAFGPVVLLALFWKRSTLSGAISGMATGALTVIIWDYIPLVNGQTLYAATNLYSLVVGFGLALIVNVIVSLLSKKPSKEIIDEFDSIKNIEV